MSTSCKRRPLLTFLPLLQPARPSGSQEQVPSRSSHGVPRPSPRPPPCPYTSMQTRLGRPQHNASEGNVAESPLARCAQTRRASRVLRPSPPWRGGPEPQHPSLLPSRPPHVETHACSGSQDSACALAPAAERPCRLPPSQARAPGAGASPPSVRGGAGEKRGAEAAWGRGRSRWKPGGVTRAAGTREASGPGLGLGQAESPLLFFPGIVAKAWAAA